MLLEDKMRPGLLRRGLLIDFDYATKIKRKGKFSPGCCTICPPYIHYHTMFMIILRVLALSWL